MNLWVKPEIRQQMIDLLKSAGEVRDFEFELRTKAGKIRTVLLSAVAVTLNNEACMLDSTIDITERKQATSGCK